MTQTGSMGLFSAARLSGTPSRCDIIGFFSGDRKGMAAMAATHGRRRDRQRLNVFSL